MNGIKEMNLTSKDKEALTKIIEFEEKCHPESLAAKLGFSWSDVQVWPATLNRLLTFGLLEIVYHSNSYRGMRLTQKGREQAELLSITDKPIPLEAPQSQKLELPDDLFEDIIDHPVHVLLAGPPALAKTLFLWDIERVAGEKAIWLMGSATSKGGLWDKIAERQSQIILIDELHTMNAVDTAGLLSIMEGGRLVRTKVGRELEFTIPVRVIAACNRVYGLSPELLSRFAVCKIQPYDRSDYLTVVKGVLVRREGVSADMAEEIARRLDGLSQDVRDSVRVARLAPQLGIEKSIKLLLGG